MSKLSEAWHGLTAYLVKTYNIDPALAKLIDKHGLWVVGIALAILALILILAIR